LKKFVNNLLALTLLSISSQAVADEQMSAPAKIIDQERSDPFEELNRNFWYLNDDIFDKYLLRPTALFYRNNIPRPVKNRIYNVVSNIDEPSVAVNNMLQGNVADSGNAFGRFLINSTVGLFGLFDVASQIGLEAKHDEFGEVLAIYGVEAGPYLMLPAFGPTTIRNVVGDQVDNLYFPGANIGFLHGLGISLIKGVHKRAEFIDQEGLLKSSLDPYTFVKEAYYQNRTYDIYDGNVPEVEEEDFGDEFDDD
jgi:phospholipid-binding lipoprotein MlaA